MNVPRACPLCEFDGGILIARHEKWRVIRVEERGFPAFYRVVWQAHQAEFSELAIRDRALCMEAVAAVEAAVRLNLSPAPRKMNLAALGNVVPHLHWHVIARWTWDSHFPSPIWAAAQREPDPAALAAVQAALPALDRAVAEAVRDLR